MSTNTRPTPGGILAAVEALRGPQQTYTREQVAYLMHLAYLSGRTLRGLDDEAEMHGTWAEHRGPHATREQRVQARVAEMERHARRIARRLGRPPGYQYAGGPVEWETGRPVRRLGAVA